MKIYLFEFYNYSQRVVYKLNTIEDYKSKFTTFEEHTIKNFNFNDYINSEIVVNLISKSFKPTYLILCDDNEQILSRWYIVNMVLNSGMRNYTLTLKRDIITDNIKKLYEMDNILVNRGYCDINNPAFFNKEDISVNEIPQKSYLLKDFTDSAWIVAYLSKQDNSQDTSTTKWWTKEVKFGNKVYNPYASFAKKADIDYYFSNLYRIIDSTSIYVYFRAPSKSYTQYSEYSIKLGQLGLGSFTDSSDNQYFVASKADVESKINSALPLIKTAYSTDFSKYLKYKNQIIKTDDGSYYSIDFEIKKVKLAIDNQTIYDKIGYSISGTNNKPLIFDYIEYLSPIITKLTFTNGKYSFKLSENRRETSDAVYDCICSPIHCQFVDENGYYRDVDENLLMSFYNSLSTYWGSAVYDVQILPFCPVPDVYNSSKNVIEMKSNLVGSVYDKFVSDNNNAFLICYCNTINVSYDIEFDLTIDKEETTKLDYLTTKLKLISPNFSSEYELPVFENLGIDYFNVDMTLLPNNPWVKINPIYNYLNGKDLDDNRGLIISGSLSITTVSNAWTEYILQNSNYSQIFESQIAYQEYQNKMSLISSGIQSGVKAIGAGVAGSLINPILGLGAGIGSTIGGVIDNVVQSDMNKKQIEYQRTQWNLQNGNIKSKPNTLSKITSINRNFKYFPYVVKYTCTDTEKEQVDKYLHLYGMNINQIGTIKDYNKENYYMSCTLLDKDVNMHLSPNEYEDLKIELNDGFYLLNYIDTVTVMED